MDSRFFHALMNLERCEVYLLDADGLIVCANPWAIRQSGFTKSELEGRPFADFFEQRGNDPQTGMLLGEIKRKDGSRTPAEMQYVPAGHQRLAVIQSRLEETQAEERFRSIFESAPNGFILVDENGTLIMVNRMAEELFGYDRSELIGQSVDLLVPSELRGRHGHHRRDYAEQPRTRAMGAGMALEALRKDGSRFPVEIGLTPVPTSHGQFVVGSVVDLTQRRKTEQELERYRDHLEKMVEEKTQELQRETEEKTKLEERQRLGRELHDSVSQALYGIGLGVRTALAQLDRDASKAREPLEYVLSLTDSALTEMRALLFKLRPQALENVTLSEALSGQLAALKVRYELETEAQTPSEEPMMPLELKHAAFRIALEALNNAVKHAYPQRLRLRLSFPDSQLCLEIEDDGRGFDPDGEFPGHHGLASMQERVERLRGEFAIESELGVGTTIRCRLPVGG
ncbi:MAG: PAS domain S-box protein [Candidatus Eremiobacteraeota bacterium]|nr:PAS domain S-box protein [Candidatus Eremiobacteraeota bacterium]